MLWRVIDENSGTTGLNRMGINCICESKDDSDRTLAVNRLALLMSWPEFFSRASSDDGDRIDQNPVVKSQYLVWRVDPLAMTIIIIA